MSEDLRPEAKAPGLIQNYVSFVGVVIMFTALACIILLFVIDLTQQTENPYFGVVAYVLLPSGLIFGILVVALGMIRERRRRRLSPASELSQYPKIDFNDARQRRIGDDGFLQPPALAVGVEPRIGFFRQWRLGTERRDEQAQRRDEGGQAEK